MSTGAKTTAAQLHDLVYSMDLTHGSASCNRSKMQPRQKTSERPVFSRPAFYLHKSAVEGSAAGDNPSNCSCTLAVCSHSN